jgi:hypothetical protein
MALLPVANARRLAAPAGDRLRQRMHSSSSVVCNRNRGLSKIVTSGAKMQAREVIATMNSGGKTCLGAALLAAACGSAAALDPQGHRGARGLAPENTLPASALALGIGSRRSNSTSRSRATTCW